MAGLWGDVDIMQTQTMVVSYLIRRLHDLFRGVVVLVQVLVEVLPRVAGHALALLLLLLLLPHRLLHLRLGLDFREFALHPEISAWVNLQF